MGWFFFNEWQGGLVTQSRFLAEAAQQAAKDGDAATAMLLALEALPDERAELLTTKRWKPFTPEALSALDTGWRTGGLPATGADDKPLAILKGHEIRVVSAVFRADGARILTASHDKTARLWDSDGQSGVTLKGHTDTVWSAVFSPNGRRILTISSDKTARLWDFIPESQSLINRAKAVVPRCLTSDERKKYHLAAIAPRWCHTMKKPPYQDLEPPPRWYERLPLDARDWILGRYQDLQARFAFSGSQ